MRNMLDKVCLMCDCPEDKIIGKGRTVKQVYARMSYILAVYILGEDIHEVNRQVLGFSHTMPTYYLRMATAKFKRSAKFRNFIQEIIKDDDKFKQFAHRHSNQIISQCAIAVKKDTPKRDVNKASKPNTEGKLFYFTAEEEEAIERAKKEIPIWFEKKYGHGKQPKEYLWT